MKAKDAQLINRGVDSELDAEERKLFDKMLVENPDAVDMSRAFESIGDDIRNDSTQSASPDPYAAWQDIRREIRQSERTSDERFASGARLGWAGAVAALLVVGVLALSSWRLLNGAAPELAFSDTAASRVDWVETGIPGATTMIYTDVETDMIVIWMDVAQTGESRDT